jgi:[acyl-carrier-protein] S-malonyltransferase
MGAVRTGGVAVVDRVKGEADQVYARLAPQLPPRAAFYVVAGTDRPHGDAVREAASANEAYARACAGLAAGELDMAVIAGAQAAPDGNEAGAVVLRRTAEAVAEGVPVLQLHGADGRPGEPPAHDAYTAPAGGDHSRVTAALDAAVAARPRRPARAEAPRRPWPGTAHTGGPRPVVLMFSGQGSQQPNMAAGLYRRDPVFTAGMDAVFDLLGAQGDRLREEWLAPQVDVDLDHVTRAQPLLFAVDYALGRMVLSWGVRPVAYLGHSIGEVAAATLAGVFSLADSVRLLRDRVERLTHTPPGGMVVVSAGEDEVRPFLTGEVVLGAVNGVRQTMIAGPDPALAGVEAALTQAGFVSRRAKANSAFHSPAVGDACAACLPDYDMVRLNPPAVPVYSAYTAAVMRDEEATDPGFWTMQVARPVVFWPAVEALLAEGDVLMLDLGPGQSLASLVRRHPAVSSGGSAAAGLLPARRRTPDDDIAGALAAAALLRDEGHPLDLDRLSPLL